MLIKLFDPDGKFLARYYSSVVPKQGDLVIVNLEESKIFCKISGTVDRVIHVAGRGFFKRWFSQWFVECLLCDVKMKPTN